MTERGQPPAQRRPASPSSCAGIGKRFPGVIANHDIDITIRAGTIHALVGENGAGKSTLMKILYGVQKPDDGTIEVDGAQVVVRARRPTRSRRHRHGLPALHAGRQPDRPGERRARCREAARHRRRGPRRDRARSPTRYGFDLDPDELVEDARRRRAPARRDPQGALPRREDHHPRRADRRAGAAGGRRALREPARAQGARATPSSSSPTSSTRCSRSPTTSP